jgi:hypothetical protein
VLGKSHSSRKKEKEMTGLYPSGRRGERAARTPVGCPDAILPAAKGRGGHVVLVAVVVLLCIVIVVTGAVLLLS